MKKIGCKICGNTEGNKFYTAKEMMYGLKEEFSYFQCGSCNCLQITEIPHQINKYYPSDYYSFELPEVHLSSIKKYIRNSRNEYAVLNRGFLGRMMYNFFPKPVLKLLSEVPLSKNSKILDVGCGSGSLLVELNNIGFKKLTGVDPYIKRDIILGDSMRILKKSIHALNEKQDFIMFHHSFEHMEDPNETLDSVFKLLNKGGHCLIRIPTVSSYAWSFYRENWVQFDAPRHFFLHSIESMENLAKKSSLKIERIIYDSTGFQFWGSEQYKRNITLRSETSYAVNPESSIFSKAEIQEFEKRAKVLNENGSGDACAFILKKE